ncbi:Protein of unknown function [Gryllus bimaculatus]|nr:Protein of unknown function [Gryllus bimaculatus]
MDLSSSDPGNPKLLFTTLLGRSGQEKLVTFQNITDSGTCRRGCRNIPPCSQQCCPDIDIQTYFEVDH